MRASGVLLCHGSVSMYKQKICKQTVKQNSAHHIYTTVTRPKPGSPRSIASNRGNLRSHWSESN